MATDSTLELSIVMPCLNEVQTVANCVRVAQAYLTRAGINGEVIVADNGSTDGSQDSARAEGARVIDVPIRGYGAALNAGIAAAQGQYVIMGDSDESYDFSALDPFVERLRNGADLVMGNRFAGGIAPGAMPWLHRRIGNPVLSFIGRLFFQIPVRDFHCGLRGFRRDVALDVGLTTTGMEFASELVVRFALTNRRIEEVPTTLSKDGRDRPPHLRSWSDGWRHLRFLLLFSPRWLFFYPGCLLLLAGSVMGVASAFVDSDALATKLLLVAGSLGVLGMQAVTFAALTKAIGARFGLLPGDTRVTGFMRRFRLESALRVAATLLVGGVITGVFGFFDAGIDLVDLIGLGAFCLGTQLLFTSFVLSLIGLPSSPRPGSTGDWASEVAR